MTVSEGIAAPSFDALIGRRGAIASFLTSFLMVALVREVRAAPLGRGDPAKAWVDGQQDIATALAAGKISGLLWARQVEQLAAEIELGELTALIGRAKLTSAGPASHNDPRKRYVRFLDESGQPRRLAYGAALFDFQPHNVITPHGHKHMVSAHMVVAGSLRVRNFDRVGEDGEAMLIRPTRDYVATPGEVSTMCSERDNIHWFVPQGRPATTFDVVISGLDAGAPDHEIKAVHPRAARRLADGTLRAPIIGFAEASARYTADL